MKLIKFKLAVGFLLSGMLASPAIGQDHPQQPSTDGEITSELPDKAAPSTTPGQDRLKAYEEQMALVTTQTYAAFGQIAQAVREGKISSDEAQHLTQRCYELGMIRFQFLDTLREITETELSKKSAPDKSDRERPQAQTSDETIIVVPPASSPDIPESLAKYLELTPAQIAAIQARISQDSGQIRPLVQQLSENQRALASAVHGPQSDDQIRRLAINQAHILGRLIVANSRLEKAIYEVLTAAQRQKLEQMPPGSQDVVTRLFAER